MTWVCLSCGQGIDVDPLAEFGRLSRAHRLKKHPYREAPLRWTPSTAPWDQPRQATTITVWDDDPLPPGWRVEEQSTRREHGRVVEGRCCLIWRPNPNYRPHPSERTIEEEA